MATTDEEIREYQDIQESLKQNRVGKQPLICHILTHAEYDREQ